MGLFTHVYGARPIFLMHNTSFIQKGQVGDVFDPIKFRWIHLGQGVQWSQSQLSAASRRLEAS
jgi:hypothetical protein